MTPTLVRVPGSLPFRAFPVLDPGGFPVRGSGNRPVDS